MSKYIDPYSGLKKRLFFYFLILFLGIFLIFFLEEKIDDMFSHIVKVKNVNITEEK